MSYFAKIDKDNIVEQVIVADQKFVDKLDGTWIETAKDGKIRKNYARIGGTYDKVADCFIPVKSFDSWSLDATTKRWKAPVEKPTLKTEEVCVWDEENTKWVTLKPDVSDELTIVK